MIRNRCEHIHICMCCGDDNSLTCGCWEKALENEERKRLMVSS